MNGFYSILNTPFRAFPGRLLGFLLLAGVLAQVATAMLTQAEPPNGDTPQTSLPVTEMLVGDKKYTLEVASTPKQAEIGLMYRTILPENRGMLFRFDETRPVAFWMKNTRIPLDMLFVQAGKVVNIAHQAQPCRQEPCPVYASGLPVDMVIELPGGTARKDQIKAGSRIQLTLTPPLKPHPTEKNRGL